MPIKCVFGHHYCHIQPDGFQYCFGCGKAKRDPHICSEGHIWENRGGTYLETLNYSSGRYISGRKVENRLTPQKCSVCGELRTVRE